jgi:SAM-dependent methyltransferase
MLAHTFCPIDGTDDADQEVYLANFDLNGITPEVFSARRMPDRMHYRMVRNTRTGCLRADPILDSDAILSLYQKSKVTHEDIEVQVADTYAHYLKEALPLLPDYRGALEIGCSHGAFLLRLMEQPFASVKGVELSLDAIQQADERVRSHIVSQPLVKGLFPTESFSLVTGFQVLDHLAQPNDVLSACWDVLAPGGVMLWICHDIGSPLARLLGERCPMIDIEHVVLYDKRTMAKLFAKNGFDIVRVFGVRNTYPLAYWAHLAPLPKPLKRLAGTLLRLTGMGHWKLAANFGNMGIIAQKP